MITDWWITRSRSNERASRYSPRPLRIRTIIRPRLHHVLVKAPYPTQATGQGFYVTTVRPENIW